MAKFEYAPAPESRAAVSIRPSYGLFIGGEFIESKDGSRFKTINPSSEEVLAEVTEASETDIDNAVRAALTALSMSVSLASVTSASTSSEDGLMVLNLDPSFDSMNSPPMNSPYDGRMETAARDSGAGAYSNLAMVSLLSAQSIVTWSAPV